MDKLSKTIAFILLGLMFILMFFSSWNDSATFDEVAHIPAGYSYLTLQDYRINPEHPPLIKDLSAFPLLFLDLNFPTDTDAWTELINGRQWEMGKLFLYESGNDPDKILRFSRFPIMLLALMLGWLLFKWASRFYGNKVGLLTLFFFAVSPTFIAHSRYVTTDTGAALGFFISIAAFINFLNNQNRKNLIIAGAVFGIAQLMKFSVLILAPIFFILAILWVIAENYNNYKKIIFDSLKIIGKLMLIGIVSLMIVLPVYQLHIKNYPADRQIDDIEHILSSPKSKPFGNMAVWLSEKPATRALGEYFFGVVMVLRRAGGGNNAYFMGEVSSSAWLSYFPVLYSVKENLAFHILTLIALIFTIKNIAKSKEKNMRAMFEWIRDNFALTASIVFASIYLIYSITGNLNIGMRHIMPALPFIYFIVARQIIRWIRTTTIEQPKNILEWLSYIYHNFIKAAERYLLVGALMLWMILSTLITAPYYLSYYNIISGGVRNGYKIATDSNYDWGQDLKRLVKFTDENNINKIAVDYFGGGSPSYYLGDKFEPWWSSKGPLPENIKWLAVSANTITGAQAKPVRGFKIEEKDTYSWLKGKKPYARAGVSIFIYKFD